MGREYFTTPEAARALGVSNDTIRRWERTGRIRTERDSANRRLVPASELDRLRGERGPVRLSARNRMSGVVTEVRREGLFAEVDLIVTGPVCVCAIVTAAAAEELALRRGAAATAIVEATSVLLEG
ncbi:MAG TPA: TOBE domain-containing protein [Gaiellaceae bacterium]|nr:TOBE domain-containing protein [Gaiellaceae bacterium]